MGGKGGVSGSGSNGRGRVDSKVVCLAALV